jgi:hypothetical protein
MQKMMPLSLAMTGGMRLFIRAGGSTAKTGKPANQERDE